MSAKKITQAEARRLRSRVAELEAKLAGLFGGWHPTGYPGGIRMFDEKFDTSGWAFGRLQTARRLGCALVATIADDGTLNCYAVKKP